MKNSDIVISKRITNSILNYLMENGVEDVTIRLKVSDEKIVIVAEGIVDTKPEGIDRLNQLINHKRSSSLEEYYSTLLGYSDNVNDIDLLGSMLDEGSISYDGKLLSFYAMRVG